MEKQNGLFQTYHCSPYDQERTKFCLFSCSSFCYVDRKVNMPSIRLLKAFGRIRVILAKYFCLVVLLHYCDYLGFSVGRMKVYKGDTKK